MKRIGIYSLALAAALCATATGGTKLTTLPPREDVRIDLASSAQGFAEEDRTINLVAGVNRVDFSWAGTSIYRECIQIRPLQAPGVIRILNVNYPPNEAALFWEVFSEKAGPARFRISYLINGFSKQTTYTATAAGDEKTLELECRVNLGNNSGESYDSCDIQLGKNFKFEDREMANGQVRRMQAFEQAGIPLRKAYIFNPQRGRDVAFFYAFDNKPGQGNSAFGRELLEAGKVRVYIKDGEASETFLGEDWGGPTPVGEESRLFMGLAKELKCEYAQTKRDIETFIRDRWYHLHEQGRWQLQNFKKEAVTMTIEVPMDGGEWTLNKVVLKEEKGERDEKVETDLDIKFVKVERVHNGLMKIEVQLPPTGADQTKWNVYVDWTLRNRGF